MLAVKCHSCDHTCVWELSGFFLVWSTHEYRSLSFSPVFMAQTNSSPAAGSDNPGSNYSNIASMQE